MASLLFRWPSFTSSFYPVDTELFTVCIRILRCWNWLLASLQKREAHQIFITCSHRLVSVCTSMLNKLVPQSLLSGIEVVVLVCKDQGLLCSVSFESGLLVRGWISCVLGNCGFVCGGIHVVSHHTIFFLTQTTNATFTWGISVNASH